MTALVIGIAVVSTLKARDDPWLPPMPSRVKRHILNARIERNQAAILECKDNECAQPRIASLYEARNHLASVTKGPILPIPDDVERNIVYRINLLRKECSKITRPHVDPACWLFGIFHINSRKIGKLGPRVKMTTDEIVAEIESLSNQDKLERERQQAKDRENERIAREAEEKARKKREYEQNYIEYTWTDRETGELSGKAIIERARIRKYRSIGNNDMAQVFVKMYDGWGNVVANPNTGHEFHELRVNCDIFSVDPNVIVWGARRYGMGGSTPRDLCAEAGYPRR